MAYKDAQDALDEGKPDPEQRCTKPAPYGFTTDLYMHWVAGAQVLNTPNHTHPVSHSTAALHVLARLPRSRPTSHAQPSRPALTSFLPAICWSYP